MNLLKMNKKNCVLRGRKKYTKPLIMELREDVEASGICGFDCVTDSSSCALQP